MVNPEVQRIFGMNGNQRDAETLFIVAGFLFIGHADMFMRRGRGTRY